MSFWLDADTKSGGTVAGLSDAQAMATLQQHADNERSAGHVHAEAGMRKALAQGADSARDYLAMMRVIGNAAKKISREDRP